MPRKPRAEPIDHGPANDPAILARLAPCGGPGCDARVLPPMVYCLPSCKAKAARERYKAEHGVSRSADTAFARREQAIARGEEPPRIMTCGKCGKPGHRRERCDD